MACLPAGARVGSYGVSLLSSGTPEFSASAHSDRPGMGERNQWVYGDGDRALFLPKQLHPHRVQLDWATFWAAVSSALGCGTLLAVLLWVEEPTGAPGSYLS